VSAFDAVSIAIIELEKTCGRRLVVVMFYWRNPMSLKASFA